MQSRHTQELELSMSWNRRQWNPFQSIWTRASEEKDSSQMEMEQEFPLVYDSDRTPLSAKTFNAAFFSAIALTPVTIVLWVLEGTCRKRQRILTCFVSCRGPPFLPHSDRIRTQRIGNAIVFTGKGTIHVGTTPCILWTEGDLGLTLSIPLVESFRIASVFGALETQDKVIRVILEINQKTVTIRDVTRSTQTTCLLDRICIVQHSTRIGMN